VTASEKRGEAARERKSAADHAAAAERQAQEAKERKRQAAEAEERAEREERAADFHGERATERERDFD
jgi:hypothetical protein